MIASRFGIACAVALVASACTNMDSATNLNPEGPPMIRQVRMNEKYLNGSNVLVDRTETVFAFGTHPDVTSDDEAHHVDFARAMNNHLRIIMDELLKGNRLEEIECRGQVDDDVFGSVPEGATPEDVARDQLFTLLEQHEWNIAKVARVLGVTRPTIYARLHRFGLPRRRQLIGKRQTG